MADLEIDTGTVGASSGGVYKTLGGEEGTDLPNSRHRPNGTPNGDAAR